MDQLAFFKPNKKYITCWTFCLIFVTFTIQRLVLFRKERRINPDTKCAFMNLSNWVNGPKCVNRCRAPIASCDEAQTIPQTICTTCSLTQTVAEKHRSSLAPVKFDSSDIISLFGRFPEMPMVWFLRAYRQIKFQKSIGKHVYGNDETNRSCVSWFKSSSRTKSQRNEKISHREDLRPRRDQTSNDLILTPSTHNNTSARFNSIPGVVRGVLVPLAANLKGV